MDKSNPYLEKMREGVVEKVVDENALSIQEVSDIFGVSYPQAGRIAKLRTAEGVWERVWKKGARFLIPAYRPKP